MNKSVIAYKIVNHITGKKSDVFYDQGALSRLRLFSNFDWEIVSLGLETGEWLQRHQINWDALRWRDSLPYGALERMSDRDCPASVIPLSFAKEHIPNPFKSYAEMRQALDLACELTWKDVEFPDTQTFLFWLRDCPVLTPNEKAAVSHHLYLVRT